jgi:Icc protein
MKVLILADTHFDDRSRHLHYPASREAVDGFESWLSETSDDFDLIAICGDITVKGTTHIGEIEHVRNVMDSLGKPYIVVPGNHDLCPVKGMEERYPDLEEYEYTELENTLFYKAFGESGVRYSKVLDGIHFIGFAIRNDDPDGQLSWLENELKKPGKKIVIGHYPLEHTRTGGYCSWWGYERINCVIESLKLLMGSESHNVLAYFCGHQHINSIVPMGSTYQIETASTVLGTTSYRTLEISEDELSVMTHRLPYLDGYAGDLVLPDKSIDAEHITVHDYHFGIDSDRNLYCRII